MNRLVNELREELVALNETLSEPGILEGFSTLPEWYEVELLREVLNLLLKMSMKLLKEIV